MNINSRLPASLVFLLMFFGTGCSAINYALMPEHTERSSEGMNWGSYSELAKFMETALLPGVATRKQIEELGLNPYAIPNTVVMRDPRERLAPNGQMIFVKSLPVPAQACFNNPNKCSGFSFHFWIRITRGKGNLILRLIQIKKTDRQTGWTGDLDVYFLPRYLFPDLKIPPGKENEEVLAFALLGGVPAILNIKRSYTPLAPLEIGVRLGGKFTGFPTPSMDTE